ncbi:MAG TPA: type II toxin-antitoxin system RelE/ParE family toxin [Gammaproteobacteria bacterium]|jgi:mRNA interferase RelE/StbE|nr:type II toxin-antitoxin system RelE/ParE family toxin [Gammaproteobacteria bacterium]
MGSYSLVVKRSVAKDLRQLPREDVSRILHRIEALADDPRPPDCRKLSAQERYRVRQGVYRIVYEIQDSQLIVTVVKIAHRRDVYRNR